MGKKRSMTAKMMMSYAFSFMMIRLADSASMIIDELIISRNLGATLLAATGLGNSSYQMVSLFCGIFAIGLQSTCSDAMGAGDSKRINRYFTSGMLTLAVIALLTTVLSLSFLDPLCHLFGADGSDPLLYDGLHEYMRGWFAGIPGFFAFSVLCPLVTLDGNKRLVTLVTVLQSTLNILGDFYSVQHWHNDGLRAIYGIGFSSGAAFNIVSVFLLISFFRKRSAFRFDIRQVRLGTVREMLRIGMPRLTMSTCKMIAPIVINRIALSVGGTSVMVALSIKSSIAGFFFVAGNGIAESVHLLSQVFYSEKDKIALKEVALDAIKAIAVVCSVLSVVLFALSPLLTDIFLVRGTEEYRLSVIMMRYFSISIALNALNACVLHYLQGTRKILLAHLQTVSGRFAFLALCTAVLGYTFGIVGIFVAIPVSELLVLLTYIVLSLVFGRGRKHEDALLLIPEDFGYGEDESLAFTVTTVEEVTTVSERIQEFCLSHGLNRRRAYYSALCVEETVGNIVEHGFTKDNKEHTCEIRVMIENGDILFRIRDDCRYFNMKERYEVLKNKETFSGIGIKLIYGIAKEINYVNLLNINTLIIRV